MSATENARPVIFGEVLYDHFPDGSVVLGGAPFNVAWHMQAFGLNPLLVSRVGQDRLGDSIVAAAHDWGMDTSGLQRDGIHATGTVEVTIDNDEPAYDIVDQCAYDFIAPEALPTLQPSLLYHGTLAVRNPTSARALETFRRPGLPVFLDVNLRPPWWRREAVTRALDAARWVKLNHDELDALEAGADTLERKAGRFMERHALDMLVVTLGARGAMAYSPGSEPASVTPSARQQVVDTVGAGDAFTSVILTGLLRAWPIALTLARAQDFASAIVARRGATTDERDLYRDFLRQWERIEA